jgi:hypothetical protein
MLTDNKDLSITMSNERQTVCLESAWELDALGDRLRKRKIKHVKPVAVVATV